mgnify:CR=1 FL=1
MSCGNSQDIKSITISQLKPLLIKENIQLLDVRTPQEIRSGFIETAKFANFFDADFYDFLY